MKQYILLPMALLFLCCESTPPEPPEPPPEPDHLAADIAELNAAYLACMNRENERLRADIAVLDVKIAAKLEEAAALVSAQTRKPRKQP